MIDSGINLMALIHTGSGMTEYFIMYMLFLLPLSKDLRIVAPAKKSVPKNLVSVASAQLGFCSAFLRLFCYGEGSN
jgi:hypothetical protein